jgi:hypothetical protein
MGNFTFFILILVGGTILYFLLRGKDNSPKVVGAPKKVMSTESLKPVTFQCPQPKCLVCGGPSDNMRQKWDGYRKVAWTCGYCGNSWEQELKDEELHAGRKSDDN